MQQDNLLAYQLLPNSLLLLTSAFPYVSNDWLSSCFVQRVQRVGVDTWEWVYLTKLQKVF